MRSIENNTEPLYESYDESVYRPIREKIGYITHLISDALKLKSEVRKLINHPMNSSWNEILLDVHLAIHVGFEKEYAKEIFEFCDDFKRTRNQDLKIQIENIRKMTQEILDGNYEYDKSYWYK
jgi:hypothetical protein